MTESARVLRRTNERLQAFVNRQLASNEVGEGFRKPSLQIVIGKKMTIPELAKFFGLPYKDGRVG